MFIQKYLKKKSPTPGNLGSSGTISEIPESESNIRKNIH
jgi:hypothetical protein